MFFGWVFLYRAVTISFSLDSNSAKPPEDTHPARTLPLAGTNLSFPAIARQKGTGDTLTGQSHLHLVISGLHCHVNGRANAHGKQWERWVLGKPV